MAIVCEEMSAARSKRIGDALKLIRKRVEEYKPKLPSDLYDALQRFFAEDRKSYADCVKTFVSKNMDGKRGEAGGQSVWISPTCFETKTGPGGDLLAAELLHELVHIACGNELDAEFFENLLFLKGGTPPTEGDWWKFEGSDFKGWWVSLTPPKGMDRKKPARLIDLWNKNPKLFLDGCKVAEHHGSPETIPNG